MAKQDSITPLPYFFVGKDITLERIGNYLNNKNNVLSTALGRTDTKSIWYSRDHISKLLDEIDHAGGDGLRICFGAYESTHEYAGQLCLMMVCTKENNTVDPPGHTNVYLEDLPDFEQRSALPRAVSDFPSETSKKDFNFGSPCPPRCD